MDIYQAEDTEKLTPGEARFLKNFSKWFFRVGGTTIALILVVLGSLLGRLCFGPIDLNVVRPHIQQAITDADTGLDIRFSNVEMVWERWLRPFEIVVKEVQITDLSEKGDTLTISEIGLSVWIERLVSGKFEVRNLFIYSPKLILTRDPKEGFLLKLNGNGEGREFSFEELVPFLILGQGEKNLGSFSNLNKIVISNSRVVLHDDTVGEVWKFPRTTFTLNRYQDGFRLRARFKSNVNKLFAGSLEAELKHRLGSSRMDMALDFHKVNFAELVESNKELFEDDINEETNLEKVLEVLYGLNLPFKGHAHLAIVPQTGQFIEGTVLVHAGAGTIRLNKTDVPMSDFSIQAEIDHNFISVEMLKLQLAGAKFTAKGKHESPGSPLFIHKGLEPGALYTGSLKGEGIKFESLESLWPIFLAKSARDWVTKEITEGLVHSLELDYAGHVDELAELVTGKLEGHFSIMDLHINYLDGLPPIEKISGNTTFDDKGFEISIAKGRILGVQVSQGQVSITGLDGDDEALALDVDFKGPLSDVLGIIDHDPLGYAKKAMIDPAKTQGAGEVNLKMSFPLKADLNFSEIKLNVKGDFHKVKTQIDIDKTPVDIEAGDIKLIVDESHLEAKGNAKINQLSSNVDATAFFLDSKPKPWEVQIVVDTVASEADFKRLGYDYTEFLAGKAKCKLTYRYIGKDKSSLGMSFGLKNTKLAVPQIGWLKSVGDPASLSFALDIGKNGVNKITNIDVKSDYLKAKGKADFDNSHKLHAIYLTSVETQHSYGAVSVIFPGENEYEIHLNGKKIDIEPFLEYLDAENQAPQYDKPLTVRITTNVDRLRLRDGAEFRDVNSSIDLTADAGDIRWLKVKLNAAAGEGKSSNGRMGAQEGGISLDLEPNEIGGQSLKIHANDAGQLFRNLKVYDKLHSGSMTLNASRVEEGPFVGTLDIDNFDATDIPLAGRLVSVLSPMGIVNLFSAKGRLTINSFNCDFSYSDKEVSFTNGVGKSISVGFTGEGKMNRVKNTFDINGNIIPAYVLNSILDNIPIVGSLLTGGKGEGLFAVSYTIEGSMDDPKITVNPLTALAPGFIRNLFQGL